MPSTADNNALLLAPVFFGPLSEAAGATTLADISGGENPLTVLFGAPGATSITGDGEPSFSGNVATPFAQTTTFVLPASKLSVSVKVKPIATGLRVFWGSSTTPAFWLGKDGSDRAALSYNGGIIAGTTSLFDGNEHDVVGTLDLATGAAKVYVDGALEATGTLSTASFTGTGFAVCGLPNSGDYFTGLVSKVLVFDYVLTAAQVRFLSTNFSKTKKLILPTDPNISYSPGNWRKTSTYAVANTSGAEFQVGLTGTANASAIIDTSSMDAAALASGSHPRVWTKASDLNSGAWQNSQLTAGQTLLAIASGAPATQRDVQVGAFMFDAGIATPHQFDEGQCLKVWGLIVDTAGSTTALASPPPTDVEYSYGDSQPDGAWSTAMPLQGTYANGGDSRLSFVNGVAAADGCRLGKICYGGQCWNGSTSGNGTPSFESTWDKYSSGHSRLDGNGKFIDPPRRVYIWLGENGAGATQVANTLPAVRAACPSYTEIFVVIPTSQASLSALTAGFNTYQAATPDSQTYLINPGAVSDSYYNNPALAHHFNTYGHVLAAGLVKGQADAATSPSLTLARPGSDTLTLGTSRSRTILTRDPATKAPADADATPAVSVLRNGSAAGVSVTVTRVSTGQYQYSYSTSGFAVGDAIQETIAATVGGVGTPKTVTYLMAANAESLSVTSESVEVSTQ